MLRHDCRTSISTEIGTDQNPFDWSTRTRLTARSSNPRSRFSLLRASRKTGVREMNQTDSGGAPIRHPLFRGRSRDSHRQTPLTRKRDRPNVTELSDLLPRLSPCLFFFHARSHCQLPDFHLLRKKGPPPFLGPSHPYPNPHPRYPFAHSPPSPPCPLSSYLHYPFFLFMLGRSRGCP